MFFLYFFKYRDPAGDRIDSSIKNTLVSKKKGVSFGKQIPSLNLNHTQQANIRKKFEGVIDKGTSVSLTYHEKYNDGISLFCLNCGVDNSTCSLTKFLNNKSIFFSKKSSIFAVLRNVIFVLGKISYSIGDHICRKICKNSINTYFFHEIHAIVNLETEDRKNYVVFLVNDCTRGSSYCPTHVKVGSRIVLNKSFTVSNEVYCPDDCTFLVLCVHACNTFFFV